MAAKRRLMSAHPSAPSEAAASQRAAVPPQDDKEAQGKAANAERMNAAKPGEFDKAAFIKAVDEAIAAQAPKNLDEADKFEGSGKAGAVKDKVAGQVGEGKKKSAGAIEAATEAPPNTGAAKEKPVTPLQPDRPPGVPGAPDPGKAVPEKAPPSATDFSAGPDQVDQRMADAEVTEDQLAKSNEPEFGDALKEKRAGEEHAASAPGQVRAAEAATLADTKAVAAQTGAGAMAALASDRKNTGALVTAGKQGAKGEDEAKRARVTGQLQRVFDAAKKDVEGILSGLDKKVDEAFGKGEKAARDAFTTDHKRRMDAYKEKRYSGPLGKGRWLKDKFAGLPAEANEIFVVARRGYVTRMRQVISSVADIIGAELTRAKQRIAAGRNELRAEVAKLPADLRAIGKEAAADFSDKFDELTESVDAKGKDLVNTLASKYNEALKSVDAEIEKEKEKNRGLVAKAMDAVGGVIKTIMQLKDMLLGVLAKAAQAVMAILKDPIGFLGNLVSAVGAGLKSFMSNIGEHLKKGLIGWLTGAMAGAGLQLPAKFDLRGIVMMIASLLGLTWGAIRGRIVRGGVPEQAMSAVETSVPVVQKMRSEGVGGMWEEIKEKVGDLKENLFGKISEYLIPTILIAGITWVVSLLNPASAFVKACKMIIDFVSFIVNQGAQIIAFVNSVLDAIIAIAGGGGGGVPAMIEKALAASIPVLIGALAAILGISGITDKVKKIFHALSKPIMKAVDWVIGKIVTLGKKLWAKLKAKFGKDRGKSRDGAAPDRKAGEFPFYETSFAMRGTTHRILVKAPGQVAMASREQLLLDKVSAVINRARTDLERRPAKRSDPKEIARMDLLNRIQGQASTVVDLTRRSTGAKAKGSYELERLLRAESARLTALITEYGDQYDARDLMFDPGVPSFPGVERVKARLDAAIGNDRKVQDALWNLAEPGNADLIEYITSGRLERNTKNLNAVLSQLANPSMISAVRMTFQEAEKLLAKGAHLIFEDKSMPEVKGDIDLATIASGRLISVYQLKVLHSIDNMSSSLDKASSQMREITQANHRIIIIWIENVTREELTSKPEYREACDTMNRFRDKYPTITFRFRCSDET